MGLDNALLAMNMINENNNKSFFFFQKQQIINEAGRYKFNYSQITSIEGKMYKRCNCTRHLHMEHFTRFVEGNYAIVLLLLLRWKRRRNSNVLLIIHKLFCSTLK